MPGRLPRLANPRALKPHPLTHLIPEMRTSEWQDFYTDVALRGIKVPLEVLADGTVVDGRHRLRAALELGLKAVPVVDAPLNGDSPEAYMLKAAVLRRHLTDDQRAALAALWKEEKKKEPQPPPPGPGRGHKVEKAPAARSADAFDVSPTRAEAAEFFNVSRWKVDQASKVLHAAPEMFQQVHRGEMRLSKAYRRVTNEETGASVAAPPSTATSYPIITLASYADWLAAQPDCDLLLTDPPYSTEVKDIATFARGWLPLALSKVKPTGRAYIFTGPYPQELRAYLNVEVSRLTLANILVWEYRNTLGPSPSRTYKNNWQAILYYHGPEALPLKCSLLTEQFAVQEVSAPDGRWGVRYHAWEKPLELAERLIRHSTRESDLVLDCFAGTGTFLIAATRLGRIAKGCEVSKEMIDIARERGCHVI